VTLKAEFYPYGKATEEDPKPSGMWVITRENEAGTLGSVRESVARPGFHFFPEAVHRIDLDELKWLVAFIEEAGVT
jgi:hypothetical protein